MMDLETLFSLHSAQFSKMGLPEALQLQVLVKVLEGRYECSDWLSIGMLAREDDESLINYEISAAQVS